MGSPLAIVPPPSRPTCRKFSLLAPASATRKRNSKNPPCWLAAPSKENETVKVPGTFSDAAYFSSGTLRRSRGAHRASPRSQRRRLQHLHSLPRLPQALDRRAEAEQVGPHDRFSDNNWNWFRKMCARGFCWPPTLPPAGRPTSASGTCKPQSPCAPAIPTPFTTPPARMVFSEKSRSARILQKAFAAGYGNQTGPPGIPI